MAGRESTSRGLAGRVGCAGALQVRPCKLGRRIHAAHAPAQPTRPASDSFRARPPRKIKKEKSKSKAGRFACIHAWRGCVSTKVDTYQSNGAPRSVRGGAVWACRTVGAMGPRHASGGLGRMPNPGLAVCAGQRARARRHRAPWMGLRRVLQAHTAPPGPASPPPLLPLLRLWPLPLRVPGRRPGQQTPTGRRAGCRPAGTPTCG